MSKSTPHTIRLQDGSLCNLNHRLGNHVATLRSLLETIPDPRHRSGRRHAVPTILLIVFVALLRGSKDLKDAPVCNHEPAVLPDQAWSWYASRHPRSNHLQTTREA